MLRFIQQLLGWDRQSAPRRPGEERRSTPRTSASSVLGGEHATVAAASTPEVPAKPEPEEPPLSPELSLDEPDLPALDAQVDGRNPYDTGRFKRPDAWNRVKKAEDQ